MSRHTTQDSATQLQHMDLTELVFRDTDLFYSGEK